MRDLAAVLDVISGYEPGDPYTAPPPSRPFLDEVCAPMGRQLQIGLCTESTVGLPVDPESASAVTAAGTLLEELGHLVTVASPAALGDHFAAYMPIAATAATRDLDRWSERLGEPIGPEDVEPLTWEMAERGRAVSGVELVAARQTLEARARRIAQWWSDGFDILVTPTLGSRPVPIGAVGPDARDDKAQDLRRQLGQFTSPWNTTGQPALSLPLAWSSEGLPIGVQLVAAYGREDLLLRLAAEIEQARPWADRRPAVHA